MHFRGQGYTLQLDDNGAFMQPGSATIAGAPATLEGGSRDGCKFRVWRVRLPGTSPAHLICSRNDRDDCKQAPAQATIASFCTNEAACRQVDTVLAGAKFLPNPWPRCRFQILKRDQRSLPAVLADGRVPSGPTSGFSIQSEHSQRRSASHPLRTFRLPPLADVLLSTHCAPSAVRRSLRRDFHA